MEKEEDDVEEDEVEVRVGACEKKNKYENKSRNNWRTLEITKDEDEGIEAEEEAEVEELEEDNEDDEERFEGWVLKFYKWISNGRRQDK
jgi:hypothetical protein